MGISSSKDLKDYTDKELNNYIIIKKKRINALKQTISRLTNERTIKIKKKTIDKFDLNIKLAEDILEERRQQYQYQHQHQQQQLNEVKINKEGIDNNKCNIDLPYVYSIMLQLSKYNIISDENILNNPKMVYEFLISNKIVKIDNRKILTGDILNKNWDDKVTDPIQFTFISNSCHPDKDGGYDAVQISKLSEKDQLEIIQNSEKIKDTLTTIFKVVNSINGFIKNYISTNNITTS